MGIFEKEGCVTNKEALMLQILFEILLRFYYFMFYDVWEWSVQVMFSIRRTASKNYQD